MPIIVVLLKKWRNSPRRPKTNHAMMTAADSEVSNSPVAAGSGTSQNVNAPIFNVNIGAEHPTLPPRSTDTPPVLGHHPLEQATPNLVYTGAKRKEIFVNPWPLDGISDPRTSEEREKSIHSLVLKIENQLCGRRITRALNVIAKLKFQHENGATERDIDYGVWLNSPCNSTDIGIGDTRELILIFVLDNKFMTFEDRRTDNRDFCSEGFSYLESCDIEGYDLAEITVIDQSSQEALKLKLKFWRKGTDLCTTVL